MGEGVAAEEDCVCAVQRLLESYAGPIAKFVVIKQIKDMGEKQEAFPTSKIELLVDRVTKAAIYDEELRTKARSAIMGEMERYL